MFFEIGFTQVCILLYICMGQLVSSYNYQRQHHSMDYHTEPGILPEIDKLLNRYGSVHTMREYIYWALTEESIFANLREKLKYTLYQKTLVQKYLRQQIQYNLSLYPSFALNIIRLLVNRLKDPSAVDLDIKRILKLHRNKMFGLWAESRDMYLSITGLLMFQKMYFWPPVKIFQDITVDTSYKTTLTQKHTAVIAMCSLFRRTYTFALEWFEASENITKIALDSETKRRNDFIPLDLIVQMRDLSIQVHNNIFYQLECMTTYDCHMYLFTDPIHYTSENAYLTRLTRRQKMLPKYSRLGTIGIPEDQLINLCSGSVQTILPTWMQANLKCYYEKSHHPYLYINPVKTEQLSKSPLVFQYYDILGPKFIKELLSHYIENADLLTLVTNIDHYNSKRIYERVDPTPGYVINITLKYEGHPIFTKFAEMVTGVKFKGPAEYLQYMDYTPGRGIRDHEDVNRAVQIDRTKEIDGNRFADLLYYLELPVMGGYTPFCQAGVRAHLVKGSMVIWINKFRNGTNRADMFHGACPVIHGNKIILAQGIQYTGQENHFKCTLNQFE